jgi:hypothetical protein
LPAIRTGTWKSKEMRAIFQELEVKSSKNDFLKETFLIKLLLLVQTEYFIEALYRLIQQALPSADSNG